MRAKKGFVGALAIVSLFLSTPTAPPEVETLLPHAVVFRRVELVSVMLEPLSLLGPGDVDGDGAVEVVYGHRGLVRALELDGGGRLLWSYVGEVRAGNLSDLDGDGDVDLVVLLRDEGGFRLVALENTAGTWNERSVWALDFEPGRIWVGDWNGVGTSDILLSKREGDGLLLFLIPGLGEWGFGALEAFRELPAGPLRLVGGIAVVIGEEELSFLDLRSGERWREALGEAAGGAVYDLCPVDLDRDGSPELVLATAAGVLVLPGEGWGEPQVVWQGVSPDVLAGDYNGDGYPDLLVREGGSGRRSTVTATCQGVPARKYAVFFPSDVGHGRVYVVHGLRWNT